MTEIMTKRNVRIPDYTLQEEVFNTLSHALGVLFGGTALIHMMLKADTVLQTVCALAYGLSIVVLYLISADYHNEPVNSRAKGRLRILDHCSVFLLVFGTCTPVFLLGIGGRTGWGLFLSLCILTAAGVALTLRDMDRYEGVCTAIHLINGWSVLAGIGTLTETMGSAGLGWLLLGGVMYTVGVVFFALGARKRYMHGVFHVFCLLGTVFQYIGISGTLF